MCVLFLGRFNPSMCKLLISSFDFVFAVCNLDISNSCIIVIKLIYFLINYRASNT